MATLKKNSSFGSVIVLVICIIAASAFFVFSNKYLVKSTETRSKASIGDKKPITGTFVMMDLPENAVAPLFDEMQQTGIDTIILLASGNLEGPCNPKPPSFTETNLFSIPEPNGNLSVLKQAKAHNMTIYFGLVNVDAYGCMPFWVGSENNTNTYMGRILDYSSRLVDHVKNTITAQGWNWDDDQFAGFYVMEGGLGNFFTTSTPDAQFYTKLASRIKAKAPHKKILMSPWVLESYSFQDAKNAYINLYNAGIDVIAPQDSMGSLKVTTYTQSALLFSALNAAAYQVGGGKEAWANIETQLQPNAKASAYDPSTITRVSSQIAAAKPYVSKMITWIYQHTMATVPQLDNVSTWYGQYTTTHATARKALREGYMSMYVNTSTQTCEPMYYCDVLSHTCNATTATYNVNRQQCDNLSATCEGNLGLYMAGKTNGVCYISAAACQSVCAPVSTLTPVPTSTSLPIYTPYPTAIQSDNASNPLNQPVIHFVFYFGDNLVIKGENFGAKDSNVRVYFSYNNGTVRYTTKVYHEQNDDVLYIPKELAPNFDSSKAYTVILTQQ